MGGQAAEGSSCWLQEVASGCLGRRCWGCPRAGKRKPVPLLGLSWVCAGPLLGLSSVWPVPLLGLSWVCAGPLLGISSVCPVPQLGLSWVCAGPLLGLSWASPKRGKISMTMVTPSFFEFSESNYDHDHPFLSQKVRRLMVMAMPSTPFPRRGDM